MNIDETIQNGDPVTIDQAMEILKNQASHSAPSDTGMDQGYTESAIDAIREQKDINNDLLSTLVLFLKVYKLQNGITEGTIPFIDIVEIVEIVETSIEKAKVRK